MYFGIRRFKPLRTSRHFTRKMSRTFVEWRLRRKKSRELAEGGRWEKEKKNQSKDFFFQFLSALFFRFFKGLFVCFCFCFLVFFLFFFFFLVLFFVFDCFLLVCLFVCFLFVFCLFGGLFFFSFFILSLSYDSNFSSFQLFVLFFLLVT